MISFIHLFLLLYTDSQTNTYILHINYLYLYMITFYEGERKEKKQLNPILIITLLLLNQCFSIYNMCVYMELK